MEKLAMKGMAGKDLRTQSQPFAGIGRASLFNVLFSPEKVNVADL
jgi:hypothetical protein